MKPAALVLLGALAPSLGACGDVDHLGSYRLYRSLERATRVEVVVPPQLEPARLARLARELEARGRYSVELERGAELDGHAARIWFGDATTPGIGALAQLHGIVFEPGTHAVWFQGRRYLGPREGVLLTVEDPRRADWPVTAYIASDARLAVELASELAPTWKPGFRTWRAGRIEREGTWTDHGGQVDSSASEALVRIEAWTETSLPGPDCDVLVHGAVDAAAQARYLERLARARDAAVAVLGAPRERVRVHLWPDAESFAAVTGSGARSALGPGARDVHALVAPAALDDAGAAFAIALAFSAAGEPAEPWLPQAFGAACAGSWLGAVPLEDWIAHLAARGLLAAGAALLADGDSARASPHVRDAQRAWWIAELSRTGHAALVQRLWREGSAALEFPWPELEARRERLQGDARPMLEGRAERALRAGFQRGVHLVPGRASDARGLIGLGGRNCDTALAELRAKGATAIALSPTAYRADRTTWWPRAERSRPFDASSSDEQVIATARRARALGMSVMLAPQLVDAPAAGLANATMALSGQEWRAFFDDLQALAVHYAHVAELADADVLCLGMELNQATDSMRDDVATGWMPPGYLLENTARWRALIAAVRAVYGGALTYAAGNLQEAEQLEFWGDLDFVGLNLYRSITTDLAAQRAPTDEEAAALFAGALRQMDAFARARGKPWIVTEFGLPPTDRPWYEPAAAFGSYDVTASAHLLGIFAQTLAQERRAGRSPAGLYLWCWSADPEQGNGVDRSFTLQNRPAAELLPALFAER